MKGILTNWFVGWERHQTQVCLPENQVLTSTCLWRIVHCWQKTMNRLNQNGIAENNRLIFMNRTGLLEY